MAIETGTYISEELSEYIYQWVDISDVKEMSKKHNLSSELGRALIARDRKVTDNNIGLITEIFKKAISNRNKRMPILEKMHKNAIKELETI